VLRRSRGFRAQGAGRRGGPLVCHVQAARPGRSSEAGDVRCTCTSANKEEVSSATSARLPAHPHPVGTRGVRGGRQRQPATPVQLYVAAAASSEKGKGRLMVGKRGPRVGWSRPHSTDVQAHRTPHEATSRGLAGHAVAYGFLARPKIFFFV